MSVLHPVAETADQALSRPLGRAAREREAERLAKGPVRFVVEEAGPAFPTREALLEAYAGRLEGAGPQDRYLTAREVVAAPDGARRRPQAPAPVPPTLRNGRRWGAPPDKPPTVWRVSVAYWKRISDEADADLSQARAARKDPSAAELDRKALSRMAAQPLAPVRPQKALDIGLFETRLPERPDEIMPDE